MAKPIANFNFNADGLSVTFTDSSVGIIDSWQWDFGFTEGDPPVEKTFIGQNPPVIEFPATGIYKVTLVVTNGEGSSSFSFNLLLNTEPTLNLTIADMVRCELPIQLAVDTICFENSKREWQLFLQNLITPNIPDEDVFDETKWPPLANALIAKLIIYDMILNGAQAAMASFYAALKAINSSVSFESSTIQVADYSVELPSIGDTTPVVVNSIMANGISLGPSTTLTGKAAVLNWLNALNIGLFIFDGNTLKSLGNSNVLTTFNVTINSVGSNLTFEMTNVRVVPIDYVVQSSGSSTNLFKGPLKYIETGPSKTEWYDGSDFWSAMFKSSPNAEGGAGGIFQNIVARLCAFAARLSVRLPMCPKLVSPAVPMFAVIKGKSRCNTPSCCNSFISPDKI